MTEAVKVDLLPCPFCGGNSSVEHLESGRWSVGCDDINGECMGFQTLQTFAREAEVITAWNTRASLAREPQPVEIDPSPDGEPVCPKCGNGIIRDTFLLRWTCLNQFCSYLSDVNPRDLATPSPRADDEYVPDEVDGYLAIDHGPDYFRSTPPRADREAIARVIDPHTWALVDHFRSKANRPDLEARIPDKVAPSLAKADAILKLSGERE